MSVLLRSSIRPTKRARRPRAKPSIREVCLLTADRAPKQVGDRIRRSGRMYQVEATQAAAGNNAPGYVHLSCLGEG